MRGIDTGSSDLESVMQYLERVGPLIEKFAGIVERMKATDVDPQEGEKSTSGVSG